MGAFHAWKLARFLPLHWVWVSVRSCLQVSIIFLIGVNYSADASLSGVAPSDGEKRTPGVSEVQATTGDGW